VSVLLLLPQVGGGGEGEVARAGGEEGREKGQLVRRSRQEQAEQTHRHVAVRSSVAVEVWVREREERGEGEERKR